MRAYRSSGSAYTPNTSVNISSSDIADVTRCTKGLNNKISILVSIDNENKLAVFSRPIGSTQNARYLPVESNEINERQINDNPNTRPVINFCDNSNNIFTMSVSFRRGVNSMNRLYYNGRFIPSSLTPTISEDRDSIKVDGNLILAVYGREKIKLLKSSGIDRDIREIREINISPASTGRISLIGSCSLKNLDRYWCAYHTNKAKHITLHHIKHNPYNPYYSTYSTFSINLDSVYINTEMFFESFIGGLSCDGSNIHVSYRTGLNKLFTARIPYHDTIGNSKEVITLNPDRIASYYLGDNREIDQASVCKVKIDNEEYLLNILSSPENVLLIIRDLESLQEVASISHQKKSFKDLRNGIQDVELSNILLMLEMLKSCAFEPTITLEPKLFRSPSFIINDQNNIITNDQNNIITESSAKIVEVTEQTVSTKGKTEPIEKMIESEVIKNKTLSTINPRTTKKSRSTIKYSPGSTNIPSKWKKSSQKSRQTVTTNNLNSVTISSIGNLSNPNLLVNLTELNNNSIISRTRNNFLGTDNASYDYNSYKTTIIGAMFLIPIVFCVIITCCCKYFRTKKRSNFLHSDVICSSGLSSVKTTDIEEQNPENSATHSCCLPQNIIPKRTRKSELEFRPKSPNIGQRIISGIDSYSAKNNTNSESGTDNVSVEYIDMEAIETDTLIYSANSSTVVTDETTIFSRGEYIAPKSKSGLLNDIDLIPVAPEQIHTTVRPMRKQHQS